MMLLGPQRVARKQSGLIELSAGFLVSTYSPDAVFTCPPPTVELLPKQEKKDLYVNINGQQVFAWFDSDKQ
jgi:hypothetical protein